MFDSPYKYMFLLFLYFEIGSGCEDVYKVMVNYSVGHKDLRITNEQGDLVETTEDALWVEITKCDLKKLSKSLFITSASDLSLLVSKCQIEEIEMNFLNGLGISVLLVVQNPLKIIRRHTFVNHGILSIDLSFNNIETIENEAFMNLPNLETILLYNNSLQRFPSEAFSDLPNLENLDLYGNNIKKVDRCSFGFFQRDESKILLGVNQIINVDVGAFENFTSQNASISLRNNLIESLPEGLFDNNMFLCVDLACNKFRTTAEDLCLRNCSICYLLIICNNDWAEGYDLSRSGSRLHVAVSSQLSSLWMVFT
jgi:hypothetical protein